MKRHAIAVFALVTIVALSTLVCAQPTGKAPDFRLPTAEGKTVEMGKLRGKVVVVNFWATWCGPCVKEIPGFLEVYERYKGKGLEIVGVSLDNGGWNKVKPFAEKMKITYPVVIGDEDIATAYGATQYIPTTVIVNKEGNIVTSHVGYMSKEDFESLIRKYL